MKKARRQMSKNASLKGVTRSTEEPLPLVYGTRLVGGNQVFVEVAGENNRYLWIVQNLAEGECEGIATDVQGRQLVYLNGKPWWTFGDTVSFWFYPGSATQQVCAALQAAIPKWTDRQPNTCYIVLRLRYDQNHYDAIPDPTVLLKGRKVLDPRSGQAAYTENPALMLSDYLSNARFGRGWDMGVIDEASVISAANYCDTLDKDTNGKKWMAHFGFKQEDAQDIVDTLLSHFRGNLVWYDGQFHLRYADLEHEAVAMALDESMIRVDNEGRAQISMSQPSRHKKPDNVEVTWTDPTGNYTTDTLQIGLAGGVSQDIDLSGFLDRTLAARMGSYHLERALLDRTISGSFSDECLALEPGDLVILNSPSLGIADQIMRVQAMRAGDGVQLELAYEDEKLYDAVLNLEPEDVYTCSLPDPGAEPPCVVNVHSEESLYTYRQRTFTRLRVSFDVPPDYPWFDHVEVCRSTDGGSTWKFMYDVKGSFDLDNIQEGEEVRLRLTVVSIHGVRQSELNAYVLARVIRGLEAAPPSLVALKAVPNAQSVSLYGMRGLSWSDKDYVEFRVGSTWDGGLFLAANIEATYSLHGVKPGMHVFWAATRSNNGKYGETPRSAALAMPEPPMGYMVEQAFACDYATGTHSGTEQYLYNGVQQLRATHGAGLSGSFLSPVYDLGATGQYLAYILAGVTVVDNGNTWSILAPTPVTWQELGDISWTNLTSLEVGPQVRMRLHYGDTENLGLVLEQLETLSAVVMGRYFQVEVEINDPTSTTFALVEPFTLKFATS
ncbi:phage tail protein [Desulfocurvibacter africanus]|nr:phage tail protein [Desulfocurvibacter africanus]